MERPAGIAAFAAVISAEFLRLITLNCFERKREARAGRRADQDLPAPRNQGRLPYLHNGRLPTLEHTIKFFNLVLQWRMTRDGKADLVAFLQVLYSGFRGGVE